MGADSHFVLWLTQGPYSHFGPLGWLRGPILVLAPLVDGGADSHFGPLVD